jgi:hypothetical protein
MGQFVKVNGDYNIKTAEGGNIYLDTGSGIGNVVVTGNLTIAGDTFRVDVEQISVQDNIITLNFGELGSVFPGGGVTLQYSGIEVDRGAARGSGISNAAFVFDELTNTWLITEGTDGSYNFNDSNLKLRRIFTDPLVDNGDLLLLGGDSPNGVLKVVGTLNYEDQVTENDDIPNKRYVDRAIIENPSFQIVKVDTRVTAEDISDTQDPFLTESRIVSVVDGNTLLTVYNNRISVQQIDIFQNTIRNPNSNANIKLQTLGTGKVEIDYGHQYNYTLSTPTQVSDSVVVYGDTPSPDGGSGLYFINPNTSGEFISKRKALTFSLIF